MARKPRTTATQKARAAKQPKRIDDYRHGKKLPSNTKAEIVPALVQDAIDHLHDVAIIVPRYVNGPQFQSAAFRLLLRRIYAEVRGQQGGQA